MYAAFCIHRHCSNTRKVRIWRESNHDMFSYSFGNHFSRPWPIVCFTSQLLSNIDRADFQNVGWWLFFVHAQFNFAISTKGHFRCGRSEKRFKLILAPASLLLLACCWRYPCRFRPCCSWRPLYINCVFAVAGVLVFGCVPANGTQSTTV